MRQFVQYPLFHENLVVDVLVSPLHLLSVHFVNNFHRIDVTRGLQHDLESMEVNRLIGQTLRGYVIGNQRREV